MNRLTIGCCSAWRRRPVTGGVSVAGVRLLKRRFIPSGWWPYRPGQARLAGTGPI